MNQKVVILYKNWEHQVSFRTIRPLEGGLKFGSNQWHPDPQWLLEAFDEEKQANRTFAVKDIFQWKPF